MCHDLVREVAALLGARAQQSDVVNDLAADWGRRLAGWDLWMAHALGGLRTVILPSGRVGIEVVEEAPR